MASVKLGSKAVGSTVKLNVDGTAREFLVVHQGLPGSMYDASCNGTWLWQMDGYETHVWDSKNTNALETSDIHAYLNGEFLSLFDPDIQSAIKQVKIPYRSSGQNGVARTGANGLPCKIFLLSLPELNQRNNSYAALDDGVALAYFASCDTSSDEKRSMWYHKPGGGTTKNYAYGTRSPAKNYSNQVLAIMGSTGGGMLRAVNQADVIRPALILPSTLTVNDDGTVNANTAPSVPASISVPSQINGGSTVTIQWSAASDAEGNLEGYKLERSTDGGGAWKQVYQGAGRSAENIVPFGTESVMYRVKAYDTEGLESSWRTSGQVNVINNTAPTAPAGITVPEQVQGGQPLAVSWEASSDRDDDLAGYSLERQVDGGGWEAVYSGPETSFTDSVIKGWISVAYRVRAYDSHSAYSGFTASETRQVNNNTPAKIVCEFPANSALGVKNEGFHIPYTVEDEEGDPVTVTESVDGGALRTFAVELGAENAFALDGVEFMRLLNGRHTLSIAASDGASTATHSLSFTKEVTAASVTLEQPMEADGLISVCVLSVSGSIPLDADFQVEVTNNALDRAPVWEGCTAAVRAGGNHVFENKRASTSGFAFNFRLRVERGPSGVGGYITSVQGGFQ